MIRLALCDDESQWLEKSKALLSKYANHFITGAVSSAQKLLTAKIENADRSDRRSEYRKSMLKPQFPFMRGT